MQTTNRRYQDDRSTSTTEQTRCLGTETRVGVRAGQHLFASNLESTDGLGWAVGVNPCNSILELEVSHIAYEQQDPFGLASPLQVSAQLYLQPGDGFCSIFERRYSWSGQHR